MHADQKLRLGGRTLRSRGPLSAGASSVLIAFLAFVAAWLLGAVGEADDPVSDDVFDDVFDADEEFRRLKEAWSPTNWHLVCSTDRLSKVRFELFDNSEAWWGMGVVGDKKFSAEVTDRKTLRIIREGLFQPLRVACPDRELYGGGRSYMIGKITVWVETADADQGNEKPRLEDRPPPSSFEIGITTSGFVLETDSFEIQRLFFSWSVAKCLDDSLFEERSAHIPKEVFRCLSGERRIEGEKKDYESTRKREETK